MNDLPASDLIEMDALLRRAAEAFAYPSTPPMAGAVLARLQEERPRQSFLAAAAAWLARPAIRTAVAASAAALLVAGVVAAVPQSRDAVAEFFGLRNVRVEVLPTPQPSSTPVPTAGPETFARPVTLEEAQATAGFPLRFPTRDGVPLQPDRVYLHGGTDYPLTVIFVYQDEPSDLYQSRGSLLGKGVSEVGGYRDVLVAGGPGVWVEGGHLAQFLDQQGTPVAGTRRTVERATLLWEENGITYRLETSLSQDDAIAVAESLR